MNTDLGDIHTSTHTKAQSQAHTYIDVKKTKWYVVNYGMCKCRRG